MACATSLAAPPPILEERKVVTTLFCDLVSFTALSEAADPEDVDRLLGEYFARATKVIESHGGTVEKFIGDAVVGVFGVPAVHEDDPERAVRAGLRILEALEGMTRPDGSPLRARCGVNTGEALVRLDVDPASGLGFLTGDAVNVAARLEAAAPPGGVVVGRLTHDLIERVIVCEELPPVAARGKREPVAAWLATGRLARRGIEARADLTPLVGREVELTYLTALFEKVIGQSLPQMALVVGEPGIGKSRLLRELSAIVDNSPEMVTWRQGYCPPFGEKITCGALAEMVRGHAGIRDNDRMEVVEAKLEAILPEPDRGWFRQRIRALLGLPAPEASREENFTAWMRFLEGLADREPTLLVVEDLHWADEALLDYLEFMAAQMAAVPLLIVGTARPELFERRPGFLGGAPVNRLNLAPLSPSETARLVASLFGEPDRRAAAVGRVIERCEGNPFFAEQSARLLSDTSLDTSLPDSVQAVIAARLDALPPTEKRLLADASVVGDVFWRGALQALSHCPLEELERSLAGLLQRQLLRRLHESTMQGEQEFSFVHALAREVAYAQLPRGERAKKHVAVALWVEAKMADRRDEVAEILAHHYATALDLAAVAGEAEFASSLLDPAIHYLSVAANRALVMNVGVAERHISCALALAGPTRDDRPHLLLVWARVLFGLGRPRESLEVWDRAIAGLRERGNLREAAVATCEKGLAVDTLGEGVARWGEELGEAVDLLSGEGSCRELVTVLSWKVGADWIDGEQTSGEVIAAVDRVEAMSRELGLADPALALHWRGIARLELGDETGAEDVDRAIAAAREQGLGSELSEIEYNRATTLNTLAAHVGLRLQTLRDGLESVSQRGDQSFANAFRALIVYTQFFAGEWDEALEDIRSLEGELLESEARYDLHMLRVTEALILSLRGQPEDAREQVQWLLEQGRAGGRLDNLSFSLVAVAVVNLAAGEDLLATELLRELSDWGFTVLVRSWQANIVLRACLALGSLDLAETMVGHIRGTSPQEVASKATCDALLSEGRRKHDSAAPRFAEAARRWHDLGVPYENAQALLGQGRCLMALGRVQEAAHPLDQAREIFERLGAKPALTETDEWLAKTH